MDYKSRAEQNRTQSEQFYYKAKLEKPENKSVQIGAKRGDTGRYTVIHSDGGSTSNGDKIFNSTAPQDGFVRGNASGNAISLEYKNYKPDVFVGVEEEEPVVLNIIYLLLEIETNILYVSDGVVIEEIAAFDVLSTEASTGIGGTITKTGTEFSDWIVTGFYRKNETPSSVTENRLVSFYLTPFEEIEEEVKYLAEDVVNSLIFEQHEEAQETYDTERAIVLAAQTGALNESGLLVDLAALESDLVAAQIALNEATTPEEVAAAEAEIAIIEAAIIGVEADIAEINAPFIAQLNELFSDLQAALDKDLILSSQFRIGETVYSSADNFVNPIVVTATNDAGGALTTRFAGGVDVGYGWIVANDRLKDNSDEFGGGRKRGASLYRGRINTSSLPSTAPDNDGTGDMLTGGYYTFGTYSGSPALIVRSLSGIDFEGGLPAKIRFFRDVLAESIDELIDLSTDVIQNDVYDLTPLGSTLVSGGILYAYAITLNGDGITTLPIPIKDTIALFLIDGDEFTYTDVYFNQKENFVRRKMYEFTMTGDHDTDVWLNQERMITQKVGYRYFQGYKDPQDGDPDRFVRSGFKHFREIGVDIRQGFDNETQLFVKTTDTTDVDTLRSNTFFVDTEGEQNLVEQRNYFDENLAPAILPIPIDGNLIGSELVVLTSLNTDGEVIPTLQTIDLTAPPLEAIENEVEAPEGIDTEVYNILSQSAWLAS